MTTDSFWRRQARAAIAEAVRELPADAGLDARTEAVDAAYPFGQRRYHPYKMWLKERRAYLARFGYVSKAKDSRIPLFESPLERAKRRAEERSTT